MMEFKNRIKVGKDKFFLLTSSGTIMQYSSRYTVKNSFRLQPDASLLRAYC